MNENSARALLARAAACAACLATMGAIAQPTQTAAPVAPQQSAAQAPALAERGVELSLAYTADGLGNVSGGTRRGWVYQGKIELLLAADLEKLAGLDGWRLHAHGFNIHNTGRMRRDYVGGINTIAAIEGVDRNRLSELWLEKAFADGKANLRFGQLVADVEFFFSAVSSLFLQSDWATIAAVNLPSGAPAYPLSTPGVRLRLDPTPDASLLVAVYNGDPAGPGPGDEQKRNPHGLSFRTSDSALVMAEAQLRANHGKDDAGLARTLKLGAWSHRGSFEDKRYADDGRLIADPLSSGTPAQRKRNLGVYAVIEQQVHRPTGGGAESGVSLFGRIAGTHADRNTVDFYFDVGVVFAGMIASRPDDRFGASFMYARFSDAVRGADRDQIAFSGTPGVVRDYEANLELTYSAQMTRGWSLQPMITFVRHPGGDASRDAVVTGVRSLLRL